ncbi:hypothetical protein NPX13_g10220 [Xylaria arbuscula]|uniref:Uncharacterized protein n=1 Tax=Xylaria arbuscula TaxID=114810 RepID=A0A9W8THP2_9PEZI|nr:hypothetical protein NPX13_g10220 [Xylaria arbuscula]
MGIELRDKDWAEMGNLIDVGEEEEEEEEEKGPRPLLLPRRTESAIANEKFDPSVKSVLEQKSDALTRELKVMSRTSSDPHPTKSGSTVSSSSSAWGLPGDASSRVDSTVIGERSASFPHAAPTGQSTARHSVHSYPESDDEYGDAPITMIDDDEGELTMVEPLSIDDEPPR